jgi:hypothetical protein
MALYKVEGPDGFLYKFEGPDNASEEERLGYASHLHDQRMARLKEHETKTGFIPAVKAGAREFLGGTEQALGMSDLAQEQFKKARETSEGTTAEDVERAKKKGTLSYLGALASKNITEPLGGIAGRFGAPLVAGALAPEEAVLGIPAAAAYMGAANLPAEIGTSVQAQREAGTEISPIKAIAAGLAKDTIAVLGFPGTGAITKAIGPKLLSEAELLAPRVAEGAITKEEALASLSSRTKSYVQSMAANTVGGGAMMIGTEEIERAQSGQPLLTGSEALDRLKQAAILSPVFGALHPTGRTQAETLIEAGKVKYDNIQNQLSSLRDLAQSRELTRQENIKLAQLEKEANEIKMEMQRVQEANQSNEAASKAYIEDRFKQYKDQEELPFNTAMNPQADMFSPEANLPSITSLEQQRLKQPTIATKAPKAEEAPVTLDPSKPIDNSITKAFNISNSAGIIKKIMGKDPNVPEDNELIKKALNKYIEIYTGYPNFKQDKVDLINKYIDSLPKTGEENVIKHPELKLEGNRDGVPSSSIRGPKPAEGAPEANIGAVEPNRDVIREPIEREGTEPTTLEQIQQAEEAKQLAAQKAKSVTSTSQEIKQNINNLNLQFEDLANKARALNRPEDQVQHQLVISQLDAIDKEQKRLKREYDKAETKEFLESPSQEVAKPITKEQRVIDAFNKGVSAKDIASGFEMRPEDVNNILVKAGVMKPEVAKPVEAPKVEAPVVAEDRLSKIKAVAEKVQPKKEAIALTDDEKFARQLAAEELAATRSKRKVDKESLDRQKAEEKEAKKIAREADEGFDADEMYAKQPEAIADTGRTREDIEKEITNAVGPNGKKAMDRGDLNVISSKEIPPTATVPANSPAFYHEGKAYLIHDRLKEGEALPYLHHETGVHYGLEKMIGTDIYNNVLKRFETLNGKDQRVTDAHAFVDKNYPELTPGTKSYQEEVAARLVESAPNHSLVRRLISAVKSFLVRKGFMKADALSVKDLQDITIRSLRESLKGKLEPTKTEGTQLAKKAPEPNAYLNEIYTRAGGSGAKAEENLFKSKWNDIKEINKDKTSFMQKVLDKAETMWFSSDAAFNNKIIRNMEKNGLSWDTIKNVMYQISTSQALHREALAHQFIEHGGIEYSTTEHKFVVKDSPHSWKKMIGALNEAAVLNGIPLSEMQKYAGQALIARRYGTVDGEFGNGIVANNKKVEDHTRDLNVRNKKQEATDYYSANHKFVHLSEAQIDAGLKLFKELKGMDKVVEQWNKTRENTIKVMVDSGLYNAVDAQILLDAIEYVPFYRVEQLEDRAGPKEFSRGIVDLARDKKFRGSEKEINNVFDNMERWVSYAIRKSVGNRAATDLVEAALKYMPDEVEKVDKVGTGKRGNTTGIWVNGNVEHYEFKDPLFVHAFTGMEPIIIPALSTAAKFTNLLRKNIVLNPLFSLGQLSQDGFNAMFTSGVKHPFALPVEVFKEFVKTMKNTSAAHEELTARGAAGTKDWSSAVSRIEAEMESNLLEASKFQKGVGKLEKLSMASDNAVRQAVYNRTLLETGGKRVGNRIEGGDKALAVERAFEVINFRRSGASSSVNFLRQTVPFFGAYLQALNVAGKVLMGRGIAPGQKAEARKVLASTMTKAIIAGLIYNAMVSDDEGYKKLDPAVRDRKLIIPGTNGLSLPLRSDLFTFITKMVPEHIYQMNLDKGAEDGTKAAHAIKMGLINAIASPNVMPQAIKPIFEVTLNKDFYTGRDIVGQGISERNTEDQYTANTSELAKALGKSGLISPMKLDYILNAYFGYTAGIGLMAVDRVIAASEDKSPPEKSFRDFVASIPGASAFVSREFGNKDVTDFYELRDMVNTAVNSYNFRKSYGTSEEQKTFREENKELLQVQTQVNNINRNLTAIRHQETAILQKPDSVMSPEEKGQKIRELRLRQKKMLTNIDDIRKRAGL